MPTELLEEAIETLAQEIEIQQQDNAQQKQQLDQLIEEFNAYRLQSEMLRQALEFHCAANEQIANALPQRKKTIDQLLKQTQGNLKEIDRLLKEARSEHEQTIAKVPLTF